MAIYNPRRARELEAAARLAESQRQRELAKGQREQQALERTLGLVEGLIGQAPKALEAYQAGEAQKILSGERGLERAKPDNILEEIGQFITSPLEPGAKRMAKAAASKMAPAEVAKLQPLTTQAVKGRIAAGPRPLDVPEERKELSKEEFEQRVVQAMPTEATARYVLDESPVLQLLPERERQALAAGETQRVQAEQAAAEREKELFELQKKEMNLKISNAEAKKAEKDIKPENVNIVADAIYNNVSSFAIDNSDDLNSTDETVRSAAFDRLRNEAETYLQLNLRDSSGREIPVNSPLAQAAVARAMATAMKDVAKDELQPQIIQDIANEANAISSLIELDAERKQVKFNPKEQKVIEQLLVENANLPLGMDDIIRAYNAANLRLDPSLDSNKFAWLNKAQVLRQRLITTEFKGTGSIAVQERQAIAPYVLTPWLSDEQWETQFRSQLRNIAKKYSTTTNALSEAYRVPNEQLKEAKMIALYYNPSTQKDALREVISKSPYVEKPQSMAPQPTQPGIDAQQARRDVIAGATERAVVQPIEAVVGGLFKVVENIFGGRDEIFLVADGMRQKFTKETLTRMGEKEPELFKRLLSQNPELAKQVQELAGVAQ